MEVDEEKRGKVKTTSFLERCAGRSLCGGSTSESKVTRRMGIGSIGSMLLPCHPGGESVFFLFNGVRKQKRSTAGPASQASLRSAAEEHQTWPSFGVGALLVVVVWLMDDQLIDWRYDDGLLQEGSDRVYKRTKKKCGFRGFHTSCSGSQMNPSMGTALERACSLFIFFNQR